jgi:hypothetical protein
MLIDLGFSPWSEFIGGWAMSEDTRGPTPGGGAARGRPVPPGGVATSWPSSVSALDSVSCQEKIGTSCFVLSNFENISCETFVKHKNSRKQELALWHLVNRLVLENA